MTLRGTYKLLLSTTRGILGGACHVSGFKPSGNESTGLIGILGGFPASGVTVFGHHEVAGHAYPWGGPA